LLHTYIQEDATVLVTV